MSLRGPGDFSPPDDIGQPRRCADCDVVFPSDQGACPECGCEEFSQYDPKDDVDVPDDDIDEGLAFGGRDYPL